MLYMHSDASTTDVEDLIARIAKLADEQQERSELIKALTIHAVRDLGVLRVTAAAAANISRPTLNAWLADEKEDR